MRPTVTLAETPWRFPTPHVTTLANGLTVWLFDLPDQHVAAFELTQPVQLADEPAMLEGLATVALRALDEATSAHDDIQALLDGQGAALHASARLHATRVGGLVPARRWSALAPLLTEVLTAPAYRPEDLDLHVESLITSHRTAMTTTAGAAQWALRAGLHGLDQRAGRPLAGTPESLARITRDDALGWHHTQYSPAGATLVLAGAIGDVDLGALEAWSGPTHRSPALIPDPRPGRVLVVDVPGAVQATVRIGLRSIGRLDPRWAAARIAGHVIAGGFASRTNLELRERLGYTYGVSGGFHPGLHGSTLQLSTNTRTDVAGDAVRRLIDATRLERDFGDAEVEDAKSYRIGIAPLANETSADIAAQAATLAEAGLPASHVDDATDALRGVTAAAATAAWRELVDPDELVIAVAGDAERLLPQLDDLSPEVVEPS